ncbi:MAG TPA: PAS domain S-box protein, partial [Planctomycetota bacterium]|nr:PAS domain S-box protein [Planctomycetota bacterium]
MNSFNSTPSSTGPSRDSRLRELELLFELSRAVVRARSVGDVAEAALDTVIEATRADRASLLLFDEQNVTRFRAWRRLSPRYRAAVEGHSPWGPEDSDAIPIAVADVLTDQSLETVRDTITGEGIRALAFVPLIHDDRVLGKFMVYYDQPHNFSPDELRLAETIANQVAFAIHRSQTDEALRESEERFRRLADSMPQIVWTALPNRHCEYVNRQWSDYTGLPREEAYGQGWLSIVHPEDRERTCQASRAFVVDEPYFIEHRLRGKDGSYRWFLVRGTPVRDEARRVIRWFGTSTDIHDQKLAQRRLEKHAEELREADRHKDEFLAVLGHELRNPLA